MMVLLLLAGWGLSACSSLAQPDSILEKTTPPAFIPAARSGQPLSPTATLMAQKSTSELRITPADLLPTISYAATSTESIPTVTVEVAGVTPLNSPDSEHKIRFPGSEIVYGPGAVDFDIQAYLKLAKGNLSNHREYLATTGWTPSSAIVERIAIENSINPRLLLGLLEYQCHCVLGASGAELESGYALGVEDFHRKGLYGQLWWAANQISTGYYGWKEGWLREFSLPDGIIVRPPVDSDAGWVALQYYFSRLWTEHDLSKTMGTQFWAEQHPNAFGASEWKISLDPDVGFLELYRMMFGNDWAALEQGPLEQGPPSSALDLHQPEFILPFEPGRLWTFASGPHRVWESEGSLAALDFAPASNYSGCAPSSAWVVAVADGMVVRVAPGLVVLDLDGSAPSDGLEQTGWAILYMHISSQDQVALGTRLRAGDRIGHPSCEGGPATGTHLHIARKFDGEWIAAGGEIPFVMDGWTTQAGQKPYEGTLTNDGKIVTAHPYGSYETHIIRPEADSTPQPPYPGEEAP